MYDLTDSGTTPVDQLPKGLLSFIYNVLYTPDVHEMFLTDVKSLMSTFELTDAEQEAILDSMDHGAPMPADAEKIGDLLAQDMENNFATYYEEFW